MDDADLFDREADLAWLELIDESDVVEFPEMLAARDESGPLSVQETLTAVSLVGPGAEAIRLLTSLRGQVLTGEQRLQVVELWQPQLAWVTGAEQTAIVELVGPAPDPDDAKACLDDEFAPLELAAALRCTRRHAAARIGTARLLHGALKATGDRLRDGSLDAYRVWLMSDTLTTLAPQQARQVEAEILPGAAELTGGQLRTALRTAARRADPEWGIRMFAKNRRCRRVGFDTRGQDGLVGMYAWLPPVEAIAVEQHLQKLAQVPSPSPGDERGRDERMADALVACVLGTAPGDPTSPAMPGVQLQVLVPLSTLFGLREDPGELRGYGELPAGLVRELAGDASWQRWVYDEVTGHLQDLGKHHYRLNTELAAFVPARDRYCRFPSCGRPAAHCDRDHTEPFNHANGPTCHPPDNRGDTQDPRDTGDPPGSDQPKGGRDDDTGGPPDSDTRQPQDRPVDGARPDNDAGETRPDGDAGDAQPDGDARLANDGGDARPDEGARDARPDGHGGEAWLANSARGAQSDGDAGAARADGDGGMAPLAGGARDARSDGDAGAARPDSDASDARPDAGARNARPDGEAGDEREGGETVEPQGEDGCPHPGGSTSARNLSALCRGTHRAKTHGDYQTRQDPDGTQHWITPLGRTYTTYPWDYRPDSER